MSDGIYALPGGPFTSLLVGAEEGLTGVVGFKVLNLDGDTVVARTTAGIVDLGDGAYSGTGTAPEDEADYIVRWDTGGQNPEFATEILHVNEFGTEPPGLDSITPSLEDIGSIVRSRTRSDETGETTGTFSASTRPTSAQVLELMNQAITDVIVYCPADLTTLSDRLRDFARRMVALRTAMLIELSLQQDQSSESDSVYDKLSEQYRDLSKTFMRALADGDGADIGKSVMRSISATSPYFEDGSDDEG